MAKNVARQRWKSSLRANHILPRPVGCLLIGEEDETGKYILGFCFPIVPAATGWLPREVEVGRQAGTMSWAGTDAGPRVCFAESVKRWKEKDEGKRPIYLSTSYCFQKLDEMEKNGNYSPAKEEENDAARRDKLIAS